MNSFFEKNWIADKQADHGALEILELTSCIADLCENKYSETEKIRKIKGVGSVTVPAFVLTIENKERLKRSRDVGAYLGFVSRKDQSGDVDKDVISCRIFSDYMLFVMTASARPHKS